jgi:hypothetical protein
MNASDEALRRLRAASRGPGTLEEQRAAVSAAWGSLRASARDAEPPARSRSRSCSRERRKRKHKRRRREGSSDDESEASQARDEALFAAARAGDADEVAALLAAGARAGARDANRCTPLHWACLFGHTAAAQALLASGGARLARKHAATSRATPLHYAVRCGHGDIAAALVAAGADEYAADASGATPVSLGLRQLQAAAAADARLDALQAARDAARAGGGALASAAWEAAQAAGFMPAEQPPPLPRVAPAAQWAAYQAAWPVFEARAASKSAGLALIADVPWPFAGCWAADGQQTPLPPAPARRLLLGAIPLARPRLREAVREERRRWHPDRLGRLLAALAPDDALAAQEAAGGVIRELNAIADALAAD